MTHSGSFRTTEAKQYLDSCSENSPNHSDHVKIITRAFRDRTMVPGVENLKKGKRLTLSLMPWDEVKQRNPKIDQYQLLDEVEDFMLPQLWAEPVK
jgi:hypothetical protein